MIKSPPLPDTGQPLFLDSWFGRLGNNVLQLSNAIVLAKKIKSPLRVLDHPILSPTHFDFRGDSENSLVNQSLYSSDFWNIWEHFDISQSEVESQRLEVLKKYCFSFFHYKKTSNTHDIVVHLRGGDIFSSSPGHILQSPASYFLKIFEKENPKKILLVSEDKSNPVIENLLSSKWDCTLQTEDLWTDINTILNASIFICGGAGSFSRVFSQMAPGLKKIYFPVYENTPQSFISHFKYDCEVIPVEHYNYINFSDWSNTTEQRELMRSHSLNNICIRDE
mgnify:CR=1 FL=1|tara:strand:+ start:957 stop:1793 length:837 start_codon:yes stop_codon:yes gene_type:complete